MSESENGALDLFRSRYPVDLRGEPGRVLNDLLTAFSRFPYENLTKIIKSDAAGNRHEDARRVPLEVVRDHTEWGTGGTCFSLTWTLLGLVRSLGFAAEPVLADRRYGENTHCAVRVRLDGRPCLIDPGFLILRPVPLETETETRLTTAFNQVLLRPRDEGERLDLFTRQEGREVYRLTFKTPPADAGEFFKAWVASFDWDMMRYPLLTSVRGRRQVYLQGRTFQERGRESVERAEIAPEEVVRTIAREFGIDPRVAVRAMRVLERKGEIRGRAPTP